MIAKQEELSVHQPGIEIRGAEIGEPSPFNFDDIQMDIKSNLRFQDGDDQPEIRNMLQGIENELDGIFE